MRTESKRESFNVSNNIHNVSHTKKKNTYCYFILCGAIVHSCIQPVSELNCHLFHVFSNECKKKYFPASLLCYFIKQTRNVHQQHQKLFNIKINVYEENEKEKKK